MLLLNLIVKSKSAEIICAIYFEYNKRKRHLKEVDGGTTVVSLCCLPPSPLLRNLERQRKSCPFYWNVRRLLNHRLSPVPELSFLPAPYRGSTRAGERRVQDNLHAHAQNDAIFYPQIGGKTIFGSTFQIWLVARFSEWQHTNNNLCIQID